MRSQSVGGGTRGRTGARKHRTTPSPPRSRQHRKLSRSPTASRQSTRHRCRNRKQQPQQPQQPQYLQPQPASIREQSSSRHGRAHDEPQHRRLRLRGGGGRANLHPQHARLRLQAHAERAGPDHRGLQDLRGGPAPGQHASQGERERKNEQKNGMINCGFLIYHLKPALAPFFSFSNLDGKLL